MWYRLYLIREDVGLLLSAILLDITLVLENKKIIILLTNIRSSLLFNQRGRIINNDDLCNKIMHNHSLIRLGSRE